MSHSVKGSSFLASDLSYKLVMYIFCDLKGDDSGRMFYSFILKFTKQDKICFCQHCVNVLVCMFQIKFQYTNIIILFKHISIANLDFGCKLMRRTLPDYDFNNFVKSEARKVKPKNDCCINIALRNGAYM
jgi:hypothetical protein